MKSISYGSIIWSSNVALRLLLFFLDNPGKEFYEREVQEKTEISLGAVNKYLKLLSTEELILLSKRGRMNFFRLNRANLIVRYLKIAYNLSSPLMSDLIEMGRERGVNLYLYGSVARGEDDEHSDWDVLALGSLRLGEIEEVLSRIREKHGRRVKVSIFRANDWVKMAKDDPAFYEMVERDKIELV